MIYVDTLNYYNRKGRLTGYWCHMIADTPDELRAFADRLGLRPAWIQDAGTWKEHFDLRGKATRDRAIRLGAVEITRRELGYKMVARREAQAVHG